MIDVKVHLAYRPVVALCDSELVGKKFEQDIRELNCRENFFKGTSISHEEAVKLIKKHSREDATFNIVGKHALKAAHEAGLIEKDEFMTIQEVPFTLVLI